MLALREFGAVGRDEQRQVRKLRQRGPRGFKDQDVFESVGEVIFEVEMTC